MFTPLTSLVLIPVVAAAPIARPATVAAATSVPIYFAGESHAGHYIPLMVQKLLYYATSGITWDVRGAALGNAWVDPWHQYDATRAARALGIISDAEASRIVVKEKSCQAKLSRGTYVSKECWDLLDDVLRVTRTRAGRIGLGANQYDARDAVPIQSVPPVDRVVQNASDSVV